jgi:hypothetical protein
MLFARNSTRMRINGPEETPYTEYKGSDLNEDKRTVQNENGRGTTSDERAQNCQPGHG